MLSIQDKLLLQKTSQYLSAGNPQLTDEEVKRSYMIYCDLLDTMSHLVEYRLTTRALIHDLYTIELMVNNRHLWDDDLTLGVAHVEVPQKIVRRNPFKAEIQSSRATGS